MMNLSKLSFVQVMLPFYKLSRRFRLDSGIRSLLLPNAYKEAIYALGK